MEQISIFDESERLAKLSKLGDNLERLNSVIKLGNVSNNNK